MDFAGALRLLEISSSETVSRRHPGRLERMREFLRLLGDPQRSLRCIHVGGTAGKGSTASMCGAILSTAGLRVGLHTKPHLHSVTERARLDGIPVSEARFAEVFSGLLGAIDEMNRSHWGRPSYFEILVALAFQLFVEEKVDVAVIEVGIGGTLDGTNVITPLVSVLTNVGLDHVDVLGDTIEAVATDKAGIIKPGVPIVTAAAHPGALRVIRDVASRLGAPLTVVAEACRIDRLPPESAYVQTFAVTTASQTYRATMPLLGAFQLTNAATAILACERVKSLCGGASANVAAGLGALTLAGRMEYYPSRPSLLFDVAHNAEKGAALRQALDDHFAGRRFVFVVAIADGKDAGGMLAAWKGLPAQFIFTSFSVQHRQALRPQSLSLMAEREGFAARAVDDPVEALSVARRIGSASDIIVATGSTFLVATLREWFLANAVEEQRHARA